MAPMPAAAHYLDPHTLAAVGPVELRARMIVEGLMQGQHRSPYQGFSIEFAQHRQYAPGDDTRFLDWKVYGKTDKLYLKQYQKETNLDMVLLVDVSPSMAYAGGEMRSPKPEVRSSKSRGNAKSEGRNWRKFDHAATLAAAMAHLALRQQDRVALMLFTDQIERSTRLSNARDQWRAVTDLLTAAPPEAPPRPTDEGEARTDFGRVLDQVLARLRQRSLVVLISDLLDPLGARAGDHARDDEDEETGGDGADSGGLGGGGLVRGLARLHHRRHDVMVLQTLDHAELEFPFRRAAQFVGLEAEGRLPVDPRALREAYLAALKRHLTQVEEATRRFRFDYLTLDTSESLGPPLGAFLARRAAAVGK